jgi:hypothetical protein
MWRRGVQSGNIWRKSLHMYEEGRRTAAEEGGDTKINYNMYAHKIYVSISIKHKFDHQNIK